MVVWILDGEALYGGDGEQVGVRGDEDGGRLTRGQIVVTAREGARDLHGVVGAQRLREAEVGCTFE